MGIYTGALRRGTIVVLASAVFSAVLGGCASQQAPSSSLQRMQQQMTNRLTMDCFRDQEGARLLYGHGEVYSVCRRWAARAVDARFAVGGN